MQAGMIDFVNMADQKPGKPGLYLVIRNRFGVRWYELLMFDGRFWVTGMSDDRDAVIEKWCELEAL